MYIQTFKTKSAQLPKYTSMHRLLAFLWFFSLAACPKLFAQNLVPDGSFEEAYDCPSSYGGVKMGILKRWKASPPESTPDYFHVCSKDFGAPQNLCGKKSPYEGKGYVGIIARIGEPEVKNSQIELYYREHIQAKLLAPLQAGHRYVVEMQVALSEYSNYAVSGLGILLSKQALVIGEADEFAPQVKSDFLDKSQWIRIADTITALGGEEYITIGDFSSFANRSIRKITDKTKFQKKFPYNRAYYFIDAVSVQWLDAPPLLGKSRSPQKATSMVYKSKDFGDISAGKPIVLQNIFFESGKATLLESSKEELQKLRDFLNAQPQIQIRVVGHTDNIGSDQDNLALSQARAKSVADYLLGQGIAAGRIRSEGVGSRAPLAGNEDEAGRRQNRRVEFWIEE